MILPHRSFEFPKLQTTTWRLFDRQVAVEYCYRKLYSVNMFRVDLRHGLDFQTHSTISLRIQMRSQSKQKTNSTSDELLNTRVF